MNNLQLTFIFISILAAGVHPATSMSRWFSATYHDLRFTLHRFSQCSNYGLLAPLPDFNLNNETEYLIHQVRNFLDQADYDNEQLKNVSSLMDEICRADIDPDYPISVYLNVSKYIGTTGKEFRCRAIDEAMDGMFDVFKRAALNRSEPLDFSVVQFYPNATDQLATYNLTDLINTSWIKSDTLLDSVCQITDSVKEYVTSRSRSRWSTSLAQIPSQSKITATRKVPRRRKVEMKRQLYRWDPLHLNSKSRVHVKSHLLH